MDFSVQGAPLLASLFGLSLLATSLGFRKLVYFVSLGYTFAILLMSLFSLYVFRQSWTWFSVLHLVGLILWGLRLGLFLVRRETSPGYKNERERVETRYTPGQFSYRVSIWLGTSFLYVLMFIPAFLDAAGGGKSTSQFGLFWQSLGLALLLAGLIVETLADQQKSAFKNHNPGQFCNTGLYRWVRCPNYLGEILFWLGSWVMGIPFYDNVARWIASLLGLVCIILIMMGSTKRIEVTQGEHYGHLQSYQAYIRSVPVLLPFLPIYTLKNVRVVLE